MIVWPPVTLTMGGRRRLATLTRSDYMALAVAASKYPADAIIRLHASHCDTFHGNDCDCRPLTMRNGGAA